MGKLIKAFSFFNHYLAILSGWLILIASVLISYEVIMRYVFRNAPNWTSDVTNYILLTIAFLPVAYALQHRRHINVDILVIWMSGKARKFFDFIYYIPIIIFSSVVFWKTYDFFQRAVAGNWLTQANFAIPRSWLYAIILFGSAMLILVSIIRIIETVTDKEYMAP